MGLVYVASMSEQGRRPMNDVGRRLGWKVNLKFKLDDA